MRGERFGDQTGYSIRLLFHRSAKTSFK